MNKIKIRDFIRLFFACLFSFLYIPHLMCYTMLMGGGKIVLKKDVERMLRQVKIELPLFFGILYLLHNNSYFRTLFYYRIGPVMSLLIGWYRPGDRYFSISRRTKIGSGILLNHPYATILNAEKIGDNFICGHCTTLGAKATGRPTVGDNVSLGCSVTIIGNVHIGNNVTIGAGSIVVKDVPDDCVVAGNPARIIRYKH